MPSNTIPVSYTHLLCFVVLGLINEVLPWDMPLWEQAAVGVLLITALEFFTGCVANLMLGWQVWDYSDLPWNILGQVSLKYSALWLPVSLAGIVLDDCLRYRWFGEDPELFIIGQFSKSNRHISQFCIDSHHLFPGSQSKQLSLRKFLTG